MKLKTLVVLTVLVMVGMVLSACGSAPASTGGNRVGAKVDALPIEFTGIVEAIDGTEITIDGQVIVVTLEMLSSGGFEIGDTVEIEATVDEKGAIIAESVNLHIDDANSDIVEIDLENEIDNDLDSELNDKSGNGIEIDSDDAMDDDSGKEIDDDSGDEVNDDSSDAVDDHSDDNGDNDSNSDKGDHSEDDGDHEVDG